jgi:hypothetical protein
MPVEITQNFLDYSQLTCWLKCPWQWYERYVNRRVPRPSGYQRDDAMTIGTLVHNGLEHWYKDKSPVIDQETITEATPTPDALALAQQLVVEYTRQYPTEPWELVNVEEPILADILGGETLLMAKVDAYFKVDNTMELVSSSEGHTISVTPGYWVQEYKTKSDSISRANYMAMWEVNRQASFQSLALAHKLGVEVQGVIVNVIEKPRPYIPKRKCKSCGQYYELASYLPVGPGEYSCMVCGTVQKLKPYEPKSEKHGEFFRMKVTRSKDQLDQHREEFGMVALDMKQMREVGLDHQYFVPNTNNCVDMRWGTCEYYRNHLYNILTSEDGLMVDKDTTKYSGLVVI